jgi:hypothetical protein
VGDAMLHLYHYKKKLKKSHTSLQNCCRVVPVVTEFTKENEMNRFDAITQAATEINRNWSNREILRFHMFNPNGLCKVKSAMDERVSNAVDAGLAMSGALIAYGTFNDFSVKLFRSMFDMKRVNGRKLRVAIEMMKDDLRRTENFLNGINA